MSRFEGNYSNLGRELEDTRRKLQEQSVKNRVVTEYEQKINQLINENKRLEAIMNGKEEELSGAHTKLRKHQTDI